MIRTGTLRTTLAAAVIATVSACSPGPVDTRDVYVVLSVAPSAAGAADGIVEVTCGSVAHPGKTKTMQWDGVSAPTPAVGREWLCNEGTS